MCESAFRGLDCDTVQWSLWYPEIPLCYIYVEDLRVLRISLLEKFLGALREVTKDDY